MANSITGHVTIEVNGKPYLLRYSVNAICDLESLVGLPFPEIAVRMSDPMRVPMTLVRALLKVGLSDDHPEITLTEAGNLIPGMGGLLSAMDPIGKALALAFPNAVASKSPPDQPSQSLGGTGSVS